VLPIIALIAVLQQQPASSPTVARVVVSPAQRTMIVGDTLRLSARALDASGRPVRNASIRFVPAGGFFEASVDTSGLITSGAVGTVPVAVIAIVPGERPVIERLDVEMLPGPATRIAVEPRPGRLLAGQRVRLAARAFSAAGDERADRVAWRSSAPTVARVDDNGMLTAIAAGRATITAGAGRASEALPVEVVAATVSGVEVAPATTTARTGDVVAFRATVRDRAGRAIAGLTPAWSLAPGEGWIGADGAFVGYSPGEYTVTANFGDHSATAVVTVGERDVRRVAEVVGRVPMSHGATSEVWVHPNGRYAYLGTALGLDRFYVVDISDPANPFITDSVMGSMRSVNDLMSTPDGRYLVYTREGAADRRNGIGIVSLEDPAHPKEVALFTDGVTAGVHSAFVYHQPRFGTHVYLTNDGTGAIHIVDITDAERPREVAQWRTPRTDAGRMLHDVDVQDGLAYLSYWNDGLVILDVGNGVKGGSPSNPQFVSQFKYDLDAMYRTVERETGTGFIRGTHTAWRHGKYLFIADEVFGLEDLQRLSSGATRAFGNLQVLDVSDLERPRAVAWYEPEVGGVHNIWVAGDTLYMGVYNGGFRAFDVSGELRGDLRAQGREIAAFMPIDPAGRVPNAAMTWGVVVKDDLIFIPDMNSGLWIVRLRERGPLTP
jgi:hypothetical protein